MSKTTSELNLEIQLELERRIIQKIQDNINADIKIFWDGNENSKPMGVVSGSIPNVEI